MKFIKKPMIIPAIMILVATFNIVLNGNATISSSWWYTILPLIIGIVWLPYEVEKINKYVVTIIILVLIIAFFIGYLF